MRSVCAHGCWCAKRLPEDPTYGLSLLVPPLPSLKCAVPGLESPKSQCPDAYFESSHQFSVPPRVPEGSVKGHQQHQ